MSKKTKKLIIIILLLVVSLSLTGCAKQLKNEQGKAVQNTKTGQTLTSNILCQPTFEDNIKLYQDNKVDISKLPSCTNFRISSGGYEGIWATVFVKPLAWLLLELGELFNNYGIAVIVATLLIRIAAFPLTQKTALQSEMMKKARPEIEKVEKKYKGRQDQESMMKKSQETMAVYKKHGINPLSGCLFSVLQIPVFFAFYEAINRLPAIFEDSFLGLQLGTNPSKGMAAGNYFYIITIILIAVVTYFSFKLNGGASMNEEQEKQMSLMKNVMLVFITVVSITLPIGTALYWISNSTFTILQNLIVKKVKK